MHRLHAPRHRLRNTLFAGLAVLGGGPALVAPLGASAAAAPVVRADVPVTAVDERLELGNNSPALVTDPTDARVVVMASRLDAPDFGCALHVSGDGGRSWLPVDPVRNLPAGAEKCYAPEVAFGADGLLYYLFVGLQGRGNSPMGAFLTTSDDRGSTFTTPVPVLGPERYMVRLAIDPIEGANGGQRLHLAWLEAGTDPPLGGLPASPNPIRSAYSDDGGATWSKPVDVSDPARPRAVAPALVVGPDHAVHVAYYDLQDDARDYQGLDGPTWDGTWSLVLASSGDGGRSFGPGVVVDDEVVPPERVMLIFTMPPPALVAGRSGRVFVAWHDARNTDWDVFLRRSPDGGRTWEPARRLNDDTVGNRRHQYLPRLSLAADGRLDAVFYDRRDDPENLRNDVRLTSSSDGGRTFGPTVRLTSDPSHSQTGPKYAVPSAAGLVEWGSRLGLTSTPSATVAAWTDTRNSDAGGSQQDIFATSVDLAGSGAGDSEDAAGAAGTGPRWGVVALIAGGVGVLVAVPLVARRRRRDGAMSPTVGGRSG